MTNRVGLFVPSSRVFYTQSWGYNFLRVVLFLNRCISNALWKRNFLSHANIVLAHECIENIKSLIAHAGNCSYDILFNLCIVHIHAIGP